MNSSEISCLSNEQLRQRFISLGLDQDDAINGGEIEKMNRLGEHIHQIHRELENRLGDKRTILIPLLSDPNANVRFNAATSLIGIVRIEARQTLQNIANSNDGPIASHAKTYLSMYDGPLSRLRKRNTGMK